MATKLFRINADVLLSIGSGRFEVVGNPLPMDARCVGGNFDYERGFVVLEVESAKFEEGGEVDPPIITRIE